MWWLVVGVVFGVGIGRVARATADLFLGAGTVVPGWCESVCALSAGAVAWTVESVQTPWLFVSCTLFGGWCVCLAATDLCARRLPNLLTVPGFLVVICFGSAIGKASAAVVGGVLLAAVYFCVYLVIPGALGAGDVKLALGVGGVAGLAGSEVWLYSAGLAPILTAVVGCVVLLLRRCRRGSPVPGAGREVAIAHGPSMCLATVWALIATYIG